MKIMMKKLLFILPVISLFILSGCLDDEGENSQTFSGEPLIVSETQPAMVGTRFTTTGAYTSMQLYAPMLDGKFPVGQCLLANFKIDYNNQPQPDYYTISNMSGYEKVPSSSVVKGDTIVEGYEDKIYGAGVYGTPSGPAFVGKTIFLVFTQKGEQGSNYKVVFDESTLGTASVNPALYISFDASKASDEVENYEYYAVDLTDFMSRFVADKTYTVDLKCCTGVTTTEGEKAYTFKKMASFQMKL